MVIFTILDDVELEALKAVDGCAIAACRESEPLALLVILPLFEDDLPQPHHLLAGGREAISVDAVITKLFKVQLTLATDERLHLFIVEQALDEAHVEESFKTFSERSELALALSSELEVDI